MFCKHIGTLEDTQTQQQLESLLKEPGDLLSYYLKNDNSHTLYIGYYRELLFFPGLSTQIPKPFLVKPALEKNKYRIIKIKNYTADPLDILIKIQKKLITLYGFDFDLTLTRTHTYFQADLTTEAKKNNLAHPNETTVILNELAKRENCAAIIVSNNFRKKIQEYVELWFALSPFWSIYGREDFHTTREGDKEACFFYFYRNLVPIELVSEEGFLDLERLESSRVLDVVCAYMIDDEPMPSFRIVGLRVITAIPGARKHWIELKYLLNIEQLQLNIEQLNNYVDCATLFGYEFRNSDNLIALDEKVRTLISKHYPSYTTPLHFATRARLPQLANFYLSNGGDINLIDAEKKWTAVHFACANSDIYLLSILLEARNYKETFLPIIILAVEIGDLRTLRYLLALKMFDINRYDENGWAALHHACANGNPLIISALVNEGKADVNLPIQDFNKRRPLHICVLNEKGWAAKFLFEKGADLFLGDSEGLNPCQLAAKSSKFVLLNLLSMPTGRRINDFLVNGRTLLTDSIRNFSVNKNLVYSLLELEFIDLTLTDSFGDAPLVLAEKLKFYDLVAAIEAALAKKSSTTPPRINKEELTQNQEDKKLIPFS